jgi:PAS domain S-box-containing protein
MKKSAPKQPPPNPTSIADSLQRSEQRFSDIAEVASDWFWETDAQSRFIYFSERVFEATGVPPEFHYGKIRRELAITDDDPEGWRRHFQDVDDRKPFKNFTFKRKGPDGTVQWMRTSGIPYYDANGNFGGYRGAASNITNEVEAREAERRSERRFRDIAESSSDRFWETDADHRFTYISDSNRLNLDVSPKILIGKTRWEAAGIDPNQDDNWRTHVAAHEAHERFRDFRFSRLDESGRERHYSISGLPIFDDDGAFMGYRGSAADITARVDANRAAATANAHLATAVESLSEIFVLWDADDRLVICNEQFRIINQAVIETAAPGTRFEDHIRATLEKGLVPKAVGREEAYLKERIRAHKNPGDPVELERQDGRWILRSEQITSDGGVVTVAVDITNRKKTEEALRLSEMRVRAIVNTSIDGIITFDEIGVIQSANPAAQQIFGRDRDGLMGQSVSILSAHTHQDMFLERTKNYLRGQDPEFVGNFHETTGRKPDGSQFPLEFSISEIQTDQGCLFIAICRDISQRWEMDRIKSEFVSTVSHELRTPLTSIKGSLGLVNSGVLGVVPEKATGMMDIAYKNSERLIALVNDILDVEKLSSGKMAFDFQPVELSGLVREAIDTNLGFAKEHGVTFVPTFLAKNATVRGDGARLTQVIANLLSNAAKFSHEGDYVEISVTCDDNEARVSIADSGPGIPQEFRNRIFGRFAQADSSDTRPKEGAGLGLNISKSIIERHDGVIGFDTETGVGSTFYFTLPLLDLPT